MLVRSEPKFIGRPKPKWKRLQDAEVRIAELEAFVKDLMTAHGPGTLASEELYARGVKLIEK